jgi:hypothetical protein
MERRGFEMAGAVSTRRGRGDFMLPDMNRQDLTS